MLRVGLAHWEETAGRIEGPLESRGIQVEHITVTEEVTPLTDSHEFPPIDVGLFFPSRIPEGGVLTALLEIPWVNGREEVLRSRSKAETLARLDAAGVPVPESVVISNPVEKAEIVTAFDTFDPPIVIKPNSTTRGQGVLKITEPDSLFGATDYLDLLHEYPITRDRTYLLQEYLPDARDIRVMVFDGTVVGAVERKLPSKARSSGRWKHNVHSGATAKGIDPSEPVRKLAERTAEVMDIPILGIDILESAEKRVVSETNARPTIDDESKYETGFYDRFAALLRETARKSGE